MLSRTRFGWLVHAASPFWTPAGVRHPEKHLFDHKKRFAIAVGTTVTVAAIVMFGSLHLALSQMSVFG